MIQWYNGVMIQCRLLNKLICSYMPYMVKKINGIMIQWFNGTTIQKKTMCPLCSLWLRNNGSMIQCRLLNKLIYSYMPYMVKKNIQLTTI